MLHGSSGFRQDILVWNLSLLFLAAYIGAIFGFGHLRGWDAQSGHTHNESLTSKRPAFYQNQKGKLRQLGTTGNCLPAKLLPWLDSLHGYLIAHISWLFGLLSTTRRKRKQITTYRDRNTATKSSKFIGCL